MEKLRRFLVALGGLLALAGAAVTAIALIDHEFGKRAVDYLDRCLVYNLQQIFVEGHHLWQPILAFVILVVIAVLLFIVAFKPNAKKANSIKVKSGEGSEIEIALSAVDNVVRRAANSVPQVKDLNTSLNVVGDNLDVNLNVTVPADESLPAIGSAVRQTVIDQVSAMTGIVPRNVKVQVAKVADRQEA